MSNPTASGLPARFWAALSLGERLAFGGAALLLVVGQYLLADLLEGHGLLISAEVGAAELLLFILVRKLRPATAWPLPYAVLLAGIATVIVVPGISELLDTIRNPDVLSDGLRTLGFLVDTISAAAIGAGAYLVWRSEPS